ncbi:MAG: hypothetical protein K8I04_03865 [Gammaproteobacteria bacterium]|nr:hypothetical protein [Gammaproteobacteria bacterium]
MTNTFDTPQPPSLADLEDRIRNIEMQLETFFDAVAATDTSGAAGATRGHRNSPLATTPSKTERSPRLAEERITALVKLAATLLIERDSGALLFRNRRAGCWDMDGRMIGAGATTDDALIDAIAHEGEDTAGEWITASIPRGDLDRLVLDPALARLATLAQLVNEETDEPVTVATQDSSRPSLDDHERRIREIEQLVQHLRDADTR